MFCKKCCLALNDAAMAESFLSGMEPYADCVKDSDKVRYIRLMSRTDDDMSREDVLRLINESVSDYDQLDPSNMLSISDVYLLAGYRDSAGAYLNRYKFMDPDYSRNPMFYRRENFSSVILHILFCVCKKSHQAHCGTALRSPAPVALGRFPVTLCLAGNPRRAVSLETGP